MKIFLVSLTYIFFCCPVKAQTAEDSIKAVINNLFTAMRDADPVLLRSCFADSAILQTISGGKEPRVRTEDISKFAEFVGKQTRGAADERISFETVRIDGPLASVWTPYSFYFNATFSHCGVNSFQLIRTIGGWKIQFLIDTRRRTGCK
jgi:hypothetical protein